MMNKLCPVCNKSFSRRPNGEAVSTFLKRKYCSIYCGNHRRDSSIPTRTCAGCNKVMIKGSKEQRKLFLQKKYCTMTCYHSHMCHNRNFIDVSNKEVNGVTFLEYISECKWRVRCSCGQEFVTWKQNILQGTCISCGCYQRAKLSEMAKTQVKEKHPNWNFNKTDEERMKTRQIDISKYTSWRTSVYARDSFKCKICGKGGKLNAHHLDGWKWAINRRYDPDNGVTLCVKHHREFHKLYGSGDNTAAEFFEYYLCTKGTTSGQA